MTNRDLAKNNEMMIEVFKTNVKKRSQAKEMVAVLLRHFPCSKINFDLHDCDKILRIEGEKFVIEKVMALVKERGYCCEILE